MRENLHLLNVKNATGSGGSMVLLDLSNGDGAYSNSMIEMNNLVIPLKSRQRGQLL